MWHRVPILVLAAKSIYNRRVTATLTVLTIALSVTLLLGVEKLRQEAKAGFTNTIAATDLIVGARTGPVPLLLYSVFRLGNATNNISWASYQDIIKHPKVEWSVPISLGDSHSGFRVMGTTAAYFEHFRYANKRSLGFAEGRVFEDVFDAVLGSDVAETLGYQLGQKIVIAHGAGAVSLVTHDDKPFEVVGILEKTGTPVDRTVHVSLEGIEAMHIDWRGGAPIPGVEVSAEEARGTALQPTVITAFFVGLRSKIHAFDVQRAVNNYRKEPLLAILPGVALQQLWDMMGVAENALRAISVFVVVTGLVGMVTTILSGLNERRREMAILRSVGARPVHVLALLMSEAGVFACLGAFLGTLFLYAGMLIARPLLETKFGLFLSISGLSAYELAIIAVVVGGGFFIGLIPAYRAYRYTLADGMSIRV